MSRYCGIRDTKPKLEAAIKWKQKCLIANNSIFSDLSLWTLDNISILEQYFIENPDTGDGNFFEKLESQLEPTEPEIKKFAAELLWLMLLSPSNITVLKKRENILRIWSWSDEELGADHPVLTDDVMGGIGSAGTGFNTNRWRELTYFIRFLKALFSVSKAEKENLLTDGWKLSEWMESIEENGTRQLRHMLLFLLFPDDFERTFGGNDRRAIAEAFSGNKKAAIRKLSPFKLDQLLFEIRQEQIKDYGTEELDFYHPPLREQWKDKEISNWLFVWNPENWPWDSIGEAIQTTAKGKTEIIRWRCVNQNASVGDRAWLIRLGTAPKGIMAVGNIVREPYEAEHFDKAKALAGKMTQYVDIEFLRIIDVFKDPFITDADLSKITIDNQKWLPQGSGIEVKKRSAGILEKLWSQLLQNQGTIPSDKVDAPSIDNAVNKIYYGPPGTGKTYYLNQLKDQYTSIHQVMSREQWLSEQLQQVRWFDVVFMALYSLGASAHVKELLAHEFIIAKLLMTNNKNGYQLNTGQNQKKSKL